jgi:uncharacterized HAD superfamily protein
MVIGVDIDETLAETVKVVKEYVKSHRDEFEDPDKLLSDMHHIIAGHKYSNDLKKFLEYIFPDLIENVELKENALIVLEKLKAKGHKIVIITARSDNYFPKGAELITRTYLDNHKVPYDKLIAQTFNKRQACIDNKVEVMIDDSVNGLNLLKDLNIKLLLFNSELNENIETDIKRMSNWNEIYNELI